MPGRPGRRPGTPLACIGRSSDAAPKAEDQTPRHKARRNPGPAAVAGAAIHPSKWAEAQMPCRQIATFPMVSKADGPNHFLSALSQKEPSVPRALIFLMRRPCRRWQERVRRLASRGDLLWLAAQA